MAEAKATEEADAKAPRLYTTPHGNYSGRCVVGIYYLPENPHGSRRREMLGVRAPSSDHEKLAQSGGVKKRIGKGVTESGPLASLMLLKLAALTSDDLARWLQDETEKRPARAALAFRASFAPSFAGVPRTLATRRWFRSMPSTPRRYVTNLPRAKPKNEDCLQREQLAVYGSRKFCANSVARRFRPISKHSC